VDANNPITDAGFLDATSMDSSSPDSGGMDVETGDAVLTQDGSIRQIGSIEPAAGGPSSGSYRLQGGLRSAGGASSSPNYRLRGRIQPVAR
jgi:hypothetical protein